MSKRAALFTLGCKVNQYETESLAGILRAAQYEIVPFNEQADVYIINTCSVTHLSDRKSRQVIRRAIRNNSNAVVVVTGCYAQVAAEEIADIPGVDLIVGSGERAHLPRLIEEVLQQRSDMLSPMIKIPDLEKKADFEELPPALEQGRTRAYLKIQEGCREFCTYCIVPLARGPIRSRRPEKVIEMAESLAASGFKEIVLTGVHLGTFGQDLGGAASLADLLPRLAEIEGLERIRLSSLEPMDLNRGLLEAVANLEKVCPHLHVPLQSGDEWVLNAMGRSYTKTEFSYLVGWLRESLPEIAITTDIIVGFPGETRQMFENSLHFVEKMAFARLHVFKYSPRPGTAAAAMKGQVSPQEKEYRSRVMIRLGGRMARNYRRRFLKRLKLVLIEQENPDGTLEGLTDNYIRVRIEKSGEISAGSLVPVRLLKERGGMLWGQVETSVSE